MILPDLPPEALHAPDHVQPRDLNGVWLVPVRVTAYQYQRRDGTYAPAWHHGHSMLIEHPQLDLFAYQLRREIIAERADWRFGCVT